MKHHRAELPSKRGRMYSAGDCSVCSGAGAAVFVIAADTARIFFACPACGCAWAQPPIAHVVDTIDPPSLFAPTGFRLASYVDIFEAGLLASIREEQTAESL